MKTLSPVLLSVTLGLCYQTLILAAMGIAAASDIRWTLPWQSGPDLYHVGANLLGIGVAALVPAYLVHHYEPAKKWLCIGVVIAVSMMLQGNLNHVPWDPAGFLRFYHSIFATGDMNAVALFLAMLLCPLSWLWLFEKPMAPRRSSGANPLRG